MPFVAHPETQELKLIGPGKTGPIEMLVFGHHRPIRAEGLADEEEAVFRGADRRGAEAG